MKSTMLRNPLKKLLCVGCVKVCLPVCPVKQGQGHIWNNPVRCQVWKVSSPTSDHSRKYKYYKICKPLPPHIHMCGHLSVCAVCVLPWVAVVWRDCEVRRRWLLPFDCWCKWFSPTPVSLSSGAWVRTQTPCFTMLFMLLFCNVYVTDL